jgi:hypothetical protein
MPIPKTFTKAIDQKVKTIPKRKVDLINDTSQHTTQT